MIIDSATLLIQSHGLFFIYSIWWWLTRFAATQSSSGTISRRFHALVTLPFDQNLRSDDRIHAYLHAYAYVHAWMHTCVHGCMHVYICIDAYIRAYIDAYMHTYKYKSTQTKILTLMFVATIIIPFSSKNFLLPWHIFQLRYSTYHVNIVLC